VDFHLKELIMEDIIFNDADGQDIDLWPYDGILCYGDCNTWDAPIFFVDATEGGHAIIYDDKKENVRYSIIVSDRYDDMYNLHDIHLHIGEAWHAQKDFSSTKKILIKKSGFNYRYFLEYKDGEIDQQASIEKMKKLIHQFMRLKAFL